mgnify:CR=1 FL=1
MVGRTKSILKKIPGVVFLYRRIRSLILSTGHWRFDNGVRVYKRDFTTFQIDRFRALKAKKLNFHEPEEERLFQRILKDYHGKGAFLDVGAHVGYYSLLARKLNPHIEIHAFNPDSKCIEMMKRTMRLNNIYDIHLHREAISDRVGKCDIAPGDAAARITEDGKIEKTTIDNFLRSMRSSIYLIKMDIQGEESNALKGAQGSFPRIENILVGTHGEEMHNRCLHILTSNGYEIPFESASVENQPDGIIFATSQRLTRPCHED